MFQLPQPEPSRRDRLIANRRRHMGIQSVYRSPRSWNFAHRIGSCTKCMRQSFLVGGACWIVVAAGKALDLFFAVSYLEKIAFVIATFFTALFLLHIVVFGVRVGRRAVTRIQTELKTNTGERGPAISRRVLLATFVQRTAAAVAAGTITAIAPGSAYAYYICGNGNNGMRCSDDTICCFNNSSGTYYCCWSNSRCGDDGYCY